MSAIEALIRNPKWGDPRGQANRTSDLLDRDINACPARTT
jgi:hypothetical protein